MIEEWNTDFHGWSGLARIFLCASVFSVVMLLLANNAAAHGCGKIAINRQQLDGAIATVCHFPFPNKTGVNHITVGLSDPETEQAILNRPIIVTATNGDEKITHVATHDNAANRLLYEADFRIWDAGEWTFTIEIHEIDEQIEFTADIPQAPRFAPEQIAIVAAFVLVFAIYIITRKKSAA